MSPPGSGTETPAGGYVLPQKPSFAFKPRNVTSAGVPKHNVSQQVSQYPAAVAASPNVSAQAYQSDTQYYGGGTQYGTGYDYTQYAAQTPAMHNPFPMPGANGMDNGLAMQDTEWQQQMQQWHSNYQTVPSDKTAATKPLGNANTVPLKTNRLESTASSPATPGTAAPPIIDARKTAIRAGGGQKWEDPSLLEWGNLHRIFIGNLAGEVTDDSLLKAFSKWPSVQKARVVRDKRTTKSKGFGFVGFSDADEYFQAAKDMNGKYIGSHPVLIRRAETEIKVATKKEHQNKYHKGNKGGGGRQDGKKDVLAAQQGQGVQKKGKTDGKYKLLG